MIALNRRGLLTGAAAFALTSVAPVAGSASANGSKSFRLTAQPGLVPILPAPHPQTEIWGYGGQVPGPEIRVRQGDRVTVQVVNAPLHVPQTPPQPSSPHALPSQAGTQVQTLALLPSWRQASCPVQTSQVTPPLPQAPLAVPGWQVWPSQHPLPAQMSLHSPLA